MPADDAATFDPRLIVECFLPGYVRLRGGAGTLVEHFAGGSLLDCGGAPLLGSRTHEFFVHGADPGDVLERAAALPAGSDCWITVLSNGPRDDCPYRADGFRPLAIETLMVLSAVGRRDISVIAGATLHTVADRWQARALNERLGHGFAPENRAGASDLNHVWAEMDGAPAAHGRSALVAGHTACIDGIGTLPAFRRRGLGRLVMERLLRDAADRGARDAILISSEMGQGLYTALGFVRVADVTVLRRAATDA